MAVDIAFNASVDLGEGAKSLKSLKQEFKETQKQLEGAIVGSEQYLKTLKKLGDLRGEMGDLNAVINAFDGENSIGALSNTIGGVASGFQAATAATALFGSQNKDLEKTLLKVQASMAFADGIKGVMAMGESFAALNAIIAANPIMATVAALAILVTGVYAFIKSEDVAVKTQKELNDEMQKGIDLIEKNADTRRKNQSVFIDAKQRELDLLRAQGASAEAIYKKEQELIDLKQRLLLNVQFSRTKINKEEQKEQLDLANQRKVLDAEYAKKTKEENKKTYLHNKELKEKELEDAIAFADKAEAEGTRIVEIDLKKRLEKEKNDKDSKERERLAQIAWDKEMNAMGEKMLADEIARKQKADLEDYNIRKNSIQSTQNLADIVFTAKMAGLKKGSAEEQKTAKQQFEINKALALSSAIVDGARAVNTSLASAPVAIGVVPNPVGIASLALAVTSSLSTIAKISASKFQSSASGGGSVPTLSAPSTGSVPTVNAPNQSTTQLNPDGTLVNPTEQNQPPIRAVVVETDITDSQRRVRGIEQSATY